MSERAADYWRRASAEPDAAKAARYRQIARLLEASAGGKPPDRDATPAKSGVRRS